MSNKSHRLIKGFAYTVYCMLIAIFACVSATASGYKIPFGLLADSGEYTGCPDLASIDSLIFDYEFDEAARFARTILSEQPDWKCEMLLYKRIGFSYFQNGYYDSAAAYFQKQYSLAENHHDDKEKGHACYHLGFNQIESGAVDNAEENLLKALMIYKSIDSLDTYWQLYPLTALVYHSRIYADLNTMNYYMLQCDSIVSREPVLPDYLLFKYLYQKGDLMDMPDMSHIADSIIQQAISIAENKLDPLSRCEIYLSYASLHVNKGNYDLVEIYARKALKTASTVLRSDHPQIGYALMFLAQAHQNANNFKLAAEELEKAEDIIIGAFGKYHFMYAFLLQVECASYMEMRIYDKTIEIGKKRIEILSAMHGELSPGTMDAIFDLAVIHTTFAEYNRGIELFEKYVTYLKDMNRTHEHSYVMTAQYLAYAYGMIDKHEEAYRLLLSIKSDILRYFDEGNSFYADYLEFNGLVAYALGRYAEAEQYYRTAKEIYSANYLPHNPKISGIRNLLALCYGSAGDYNASLNMYEELLENRNSFLELVYSYSSAEQKIQYLQTHPVLLHEAYSLAFRSDNQEIKNFVYRMLLRGKAVALDALTIENELGRCSASDTVINVYQQLISLSDAISTLIYADHSIDSLDDLHQELQSLIDERDKLEYTLSSLCSDYSDLFTLRKTTIQDVQDKLSDNTVLLEYALYDPYLYDSGGSVHNRYDESHYALFVLDNFNPVRMYDIGASSEIDSVIEEVRNFFHSNQLDAYTAKSRMLESRVREKTAFLYHRLIEPVEELIDGKSEIYLATDGLLNLLPFDILADTDSTYLIENYELSYIVSGRDIVEYDNRPTDPRSMTIYYNPDFDYYGAEILATDTVDIAPEITAVRGGDHCLNHEFSELPSTVQEVSTITSLIDTVLPVGSINLYSGELASENKVKSQASRSDIVHFATHGFICQGNEVEQARDYHNLLLYTGIALSGANGILNPNSKRVDTTDDGILSGYEIARLDLIGTKLVTLSACETAMGESLPGEGVFGLRRAFHQAGAESILMSLWKVPDRLCMNLIPRFYDNWINKRYTRARSLRLASLELLRQSREQYNSGYPLLWSGFIIEGHTN